MITDNLWPLHFITDVPVFRLDADIYPQVRLPIYTYTIDLQVHIHEYGSGVEGQGLWKLSAWMTEDPSESRPSGYVDQV